MQRSALFVCALALVGCSGSSSSIDAGDDATTEDASSTEAASDAPADVTTDTSKEATGDAGSCDRPEGGFPCDPQSIFCNGAPCPTSTNYCCFQSLQMQACVANNQPCTGNALHCDEKTDCPGNQICCFVAATLQKGDTSCMAACQGGIFAIQVCRENSECPGKECIVQQCNGVQIEACGKIPGCM